MITRALDADGDWTFGKGANDYLSGNPAIAQSLVTRIKSFLGDCFFDAGAGIDWFNLLGSKNQTGLDFNIRSVIINTPNVTGFTVLDSDFDPRTRLFSPSYLVSTTLSPRTINTQDLFQDHLLDELGDIITTEDGDPLGI